MKTIDYKCKHNPIEISGGFTVYYTQNNISARRISDSSHKVGNMTYYTNFKIFNRENLIVSYCSSCSDRIMLRCTRCGCIGEMANNWRVQCNDCRLWMQLDYNEVCSWGDILVKISGYFSNKYFHEYTQITEKEYSDWAVYYKLEKSEGS